MYRFLLSILIFLAMSGFVTAGYCGEIKEGVLQTQIEIKSPTIDAGIPEVTPEQFTGKIKQITSSIYDVAREVSPYVFILVIAVAGIFGILFKGARITIIWATVGMVLVFMGPLIISLFIHYLKM